MTSATHLPQEAVESLRDLLTGTSDATIAEPILHLLVEEGYVEVLDGVPTVTESGEALLEASQDLPPFFSKAD